MNRQYRDRKTGKMVNKVVEFKTKSRKGREVPLFESLRGPLLNWRKQHPNAIYVFGTWSDLRNGHWLEYGKRFWKAAGLNCGVCDRCASKHNECEGFYLQQVPPTPRSSLPGFRYLHSQGMQMDGTSLDRGHC